MNKLKIALAEIGTVWGSSAKSEVDFSLHGDDLWVVYKEHKPDGTYTDAETFKFTLSEK